jgi:anti-sigma B factor antagonist
MPEMVKTYVNKTEDYYEIIVEGDIDASSSILLDNELEKAFQNSEQKILLNLEGLNYISSAGLGVFIARLEEMKEKDILLVFFGLHRNVRQVFSLLGLEELLTISEDREKAISALK